MELGGDLGGQKIGEPRNCLSLRFFPKLSRGFCSARLGIALRGCSTLQRNVGSFEGIASESWAGLFFRLRHGTKRVSSCRSKGVRQSARLRPSPRVFTHHTPTMRPRARKRPLNKASKLWTPSSITLSRSLPLCFSASSRDNT